MMYLKNGVYVCNACHATKTMRGDAEVFTTTLNNRKDERNYIASRGYYTYWTCPNCGLKTFSSRPYMRGVSGEYTLILASMQCSECGYVEEDHCS